jgi:hypothetical protein
MNLFLAAETWPFAVATLFILAIVAVEGLALLGGASASHWLDAALHHAPDTPEGAADSWLGWLLIGKVPLLVLVVLFLAFFAFTGFAINLAALGVLDAAVPPPIAVPVAVIVALPLMRSCAAAVARLVPRDENYAVSLDSLVGRVAVVVSGTARPGYPAQARVTTEHGQPLYVMVEPDDQDATFSRDDSVLLVRRLTATRFQAIRNPRPDLL